MSDIDLSEAIRAGIAAGDKVNPRLHAASDVAVAVSKAAVLAACPLIEAAVREQIARDIEAQRRRVRKLRPSVCADREKGYCHRDAQVSALDFAARIARGEQP